MTDCTVMRLHNFEVVFERALHCILLENHCLFEGVHVFFALWVYE